MIYKICYLVVVLLPMASEFYTCLPYCFVLMSIMASLALFKISNTYLSIEYLENIECSDSMHSIPCSDFLLLDLS